MPTNISPINVGVPGSISSLKNLSHRINTTSNFGFCQPLIARTLQPGSKVKCDLSSFVRLAPMPCPTFGRLFYNQVFRFVPFKNILKSWDAFINEKTFNSSQIGSYIPTSMPYLYPSNLLDLLFRQCHLSVYSLRYLDSSSSRVNLASSATATTVGDDFAHNRLGFPDGQGYYYVASVGTSTEDFGRFTHNIWQDSSKIHITPESADFTEIYNVNSNSYLLCFKLNEYGQNLRKVILGLRHPLAHTSLKCNLLLYLAYYRAWFDEYFPQRELQWENTNAFRLLDYIAENNYTNFTTWNQHKTYTSSKLLMDFFDDLSKCYYYDDPNYYSAHLTSLSTTSGFEIESPIPGGQVPPGTTTISISATAGHQVTIDESDLSKVTQSHLHMLNNAYHYLNKDSVVGQDLEKSGLVHGLGKPLDTSSVYLKSARIECTIGDVFATSDTAQADGSGELLGSYAGKGIGSGSSGMVHFETDCFGLFICLGSIAPDISFAQTTDMTSCAIDKFDFFHEEFDSIGYQVTPKIALFGQQDIFEGRNSQSGIPTGFGYIPRYSEWKHLDGLMNGDFTRRGVRDQLLPYSLDCYIQPDDYYVTPVESEQETYDIYYQKSEVNLPVASNIYRCVGLHQWLQNFNRIFYNYNGDFNDFRYNVHTSGVLIDDNFIIHHNVNFTVFCPGTSLSDSFDSRQDEGDGKTVSINHQ